ncbi:MarR family transcriptional regulator [Agrobacterium rhizogenes]|uniref:MarR family winged helix-turn-helix transcriptional regulator n=1 Tax=Rhizobium rhizogenes TaxID=359 RepID=UPI000DDCF111|nr:MarR family transcriptional regulator [Rhizobium rhizogenes]KAA6487794.1 MarR family transcriptional regulator [Agrobacterium sp. ICMP 7243]NTF83903.1 MarR family transcriptional regulator [Rhizobium rhizogenes]NTG03304.1 MarR family transcriptional regulator [Rhizobium rhizogenes]NTG16786.1 MarR family transcriptional regulator [Rhizobium rhizogenes]NTG23488.1 MarR family transcriptional regulator [Rhizobium rhizogenes]
MSQTEGLFTDLISQWEADFPGEDSTPVAIAMRLRHLHLLDQEALYESLLTFDIGIGEIDVLTHLRHQPAPHRLRPSDLAELCMVTTGAITGRISRLEQKGFVTRVPSSSDKRTVYVQMTDSGEKLVRETREQVARSSRFLKGVGSLSRSDQERLNRLLAKLIRVF